MYSLPINIISSYKKNIWASTDDKKRESDRKRLAWENLNKKKKKKQKQKNQNKCDGNLQRAVDGPQEFSSNPTSWAAPPYNMANPDWSKCECECVHVLELGTWGPAPGADTVNMAVSFMSSRSVTAIQGESGHRTNKEWCHRGGER